MVSVVTIGHLIDRHKNKDNKNIIVIKTLLYKRGSMEE